MMCQPTPTSAGRTYVRGWLQEAFSIPKMIISISGPSKSGKTVLVNKVVSADQLIPISGASIKSADDLWLKVLAWMEGQLAELKRWT